MEWASFFIPNRYSFSQLALKFIFFEAMYSTWLVQLYYFSSSIHYNGIAIIIIFTELDPWNKNNSKSEQYTSAKS